jgi:transposase
MSIVGGLDVHRKQITFDWVDRDTGETGRGRVAPATREVLRSWLEALPSRGGAFAVEACTGWRFVAEELRRAGFAAHLAEPADTATLRGNKKRAKTDRADARHERELLEQGRLPESWIPPAHILDLRELVRLRKPSTISVSSGSSASTRCCSITGWPSRSMRCARRPPARGWRLSRCQRRRGCW